MPTTPLSLTFSAPGFHPAHTFARQTTLEAVFAAARLLAVKLPPATLTLLGGPPVVTIPRDLYTWAETTTDGNGTSVLETLLARYPGVTCQPAP